MGSSALVGSCALSTLATWQLRPCGPCLCFILQVTFIVICDSVPISITVALLLKHAFLEVTGLICYKFTGVSEERAASLAYITYSIQKMEGNTLLQNVAQFVTDYTASHPRRNSHNLKYCVFLLPLITTSVCVPLLCAKSHQEAFEKGAPEQLDGM
jgi:hypothetical protein